MIMTPTANLVPKQNGYISNISENVENGGSPDIEENNGVKARASWGGQIEFILACVGFAVGLGNVWRFPYLCYKNGGGAFLIPYVIMLFLVGVPLYFMELSFGQFASLGPLKIWRINPIFKGLGYGMILLNFFVGIYYNVIVAYCLYFLFSSMASEVPWKTCDHIWNTANCTSSADDHFYQKETILKNSSTVENTTVVTIYNCTESFINTTLASLNDSTTLSANCTEERTSLVTSSEEFFYNRVLGLTSDFGTPGQLKWELCLCLLAAWLVVFVVLIRGIQTMGKVVYFTALFPYVLLTALLINGCLLEGSVDGILYYITPQWERLADGGVWSDAAVQIFYSLGTCSGGLIAMSSFSKFKNNCLRDSLIVPVINCATSIFAGFVIFSVLGFMALEKGTTVAEVAEGGPGLAFIVYPEALARMPLSPLWGILFFIMMAMLGFSSQFSIMETVISAIGDEYPQILRATRGRNIAFRGVICLISFILGLPMCLQSGMYLLNLLDNFIGGFPLLIIGFLELAAINYIYGYKKFSKDIQLMLGRKPGPFFAATWCVVSPLIIIATIVFKAIYYSPLTYNHYVYPDWGEALGWTVAFFPVVIIFAWMLVKFCLTYGYEACVKANAPLDSWGPATREDRSGTYYEKERAMVNIASASEQVEENYRKNNSSKGEDNPGYVDDSTYKAPLDSWAPATREGRSGTYYEKERTMDNIASASEQVEENYRKNNSSKGEDNPGYVEDSTCNSVRF